MRPSDLSMGGWSYRPGNIKIGRFMACGSPAETGDLTGVLTRMACVFESELSHIRPADRNYVASEMTALLLSWLTELPVPVINRPTATCLCGPLWSQERWLRVAASLGIPVAAAHRQVGPPGSPSSGPAPYGSGFGRQSSIRYTVVDGRCIGAPSSQSETMAVRLAEHVGCQLLSVHVVEDGSGYTMTGADVWPNVLEPAVADALLRALDNRVDLPGPQTTAPR
jgi:hypothetical protein